MGWTCCGGRLVGRDVGWDKSRKATVDEETDKREPHRGRDSAIGFGRKMTAELGLQNVDEADVLPGMFSHSWSF